MSSVLEEKDTIRELIHNYCFRCDTPGACPPFGRSPRKEYEKIAGIDGKGHGCE